LSCGNVSACADAASTSRIAVARNLITEPLNLISGEGSFASNLARLKTLVCQRYQRSTNVRVVFFGRSRKA
jgi:hypothetical protein